MTEKVKTDLSAIGTCLQSLALVHTEEAESGTVMLSPWTEEDFRTGEKPWWT